MRASIDVGTNTVRLLVGEVRASRVVPQRYHRHITRLGGGFTPAKGLAPEAMERTLFVLQGMADTLSAAGITAVRAVGTAALRNAPNGRTFAERVRTTTGIPLEIIGGEEEARLCALGVLSALEPRPERCLIFDVGGGSTEFILCHGGATLFQRSYPIGAVTLCEQHPGSPEQEAQIAVNLDRLLADLSAAGLTEPATACPLVGTAGTVTTLAALTLGMSEYDWRRVNNLPLTRDEIEGLAARLAPLTPEEREALPGMERGRGDLIMPGLRVVLGIMERLRHDRLTVSDFGLLEGLLMETAGASGRPTD